MYKSKTLIRILLFVAIVFIIGVFMHERRFGIKVPEENVPIDNNSEYNSPVNQNEPEDDSNGEGYGQNIIVEDSDLGAMQIHFLDTGNSDCTYIHFPDGKSVLIDTGDIADANLIISYLKNNGCTKLDALVLTHWHADHAYNTIEIFDAFSPSVIYAPFVPEEFVPTTSWYQKTVQSLIERKASVVSPDLGQTIVSGNGYDMFFLNSTNNNYSWQLDDQNKYSLVEYLKFGKHKYIFAGDADIENEDIIIKDWPRLDLDVEVLKAGHHCSKTANSQKWLSSTKPEYVVCYVSKDNPYYHPHASVLKLFNKNNISILRSDNDKTIVVTDNGKEYKIKTGLPSVDSGETHWED